MDLHSGITGIWDQTIQAGAPLLTASSSGYLQSGLAEPNEFSACLRTFHAFSSITLPNCFILFVILFCFTLFFSPCTLQATAVPCLRRFTVELWVLWRTTCFCFEPAICYLYSMPTHSCSGRDSKHIVPYSLSLCHSWICPIRFHPSLLLCLVIPGSSWLVTSVACCYPFLSFAECIFNCSIACFANCLYCHFSILQPSATHLPMKAFLHCPVVLKHGRGLAKAWQRTSLGCRWYKNIHVFMSVTYQSSRNL